MKKIKNEKAFSLAELLIAVAIIAVLTVVSVPVFAVSLENSRESSDIANMRCAKSAAAELYLSGRDLEGRPLTSDGCVCYFDAASGSLTDVHPEGYGRGTSAGGGCEEFCMVTDPGGTLEATYYNEDSDVKGCVLSVFVNDSGVSSVGWVDASDAPRAGTRQLPASYETGFARGEVYTYSQLYQAVFTGGSYRLMKDIVIPAGANTLITDPSPAGGVYPIIDFNGHSVSAQAPMRLVENDSKSRLDLIDSKGGGRLVGADGVFEDGDGTLIRNYGTMYIRNITLSGGHNGSDQGGGAISTYGMFSVTGATITDCSAKFGAVLVNYGAKANYFYTSNVSGCTSESLADVYLCGRGSCMIDGGCYDCTFAVSAAQNINAMKGYLNQDITPFFSSSMTNYQIIPNPDGNGFAYKAERK